MYPQSSNNAIKKYITITSGKNPITAPTPPIIPSTKIDFINPSLSNKLPTHSPNVSISDTKPGIVNPFENSYPSAIHTPGPTWEIQNTKNITTAKIGIPNHLLVKILSILSWLFWFFVRISLFSTCSTISLTCSKRSLSSISSVVLFCSYSWFWLFFTISSVLAINCFNPFFEVDTVVTTGQFNNFDNLSASISVCFLSLTSILFKATTTGIPSSINCVVKNKLRLKLVESTILIIASGCVSKTYELVTDSSEVYGVIE